MSTILRGSDNLDSSNVASDTELSAGLALKANTADLKEIGVGQTWQDVTASRSAGVTYTNSTGKPIYITITASGTDGFVYIYVNNVIVVRNYEASGTDSPMNCLVPIGATYKVSNNAYNWFELR